ncbi:MAG: cation:proton antiporter [Gammaproteobacteria bacterium]|nr:cation:proton antiporter [Gammaproteobacteria bacterium]MDX2460520.1 cation:proton antiporter [Gammaproteobacteria bacterium]
MEELRLQEAVVFLAAAALVIPIARRFQLSPVLGFLLVGLAVGPHGLARLAEQHEWLRYVLITDVAGVRALAELGVVFLLFMIGLELTLKRLWGMRRTVFGMGSAQILLCALVIGAIARGFGNSLESSVILGGCLALSSTAIVIQLLTEQGRFGTSVGRGSFAILLAQDMAVVPILFVVGSLGARGEGSLAVTLGLAVGEALLAMLIILGIGRLVVRPVFRYISSLHSPDLFMAVTLLIIITTAAATHAAGLSAALGAFLAGLLFAESEFRHEIEVNIEPFKGLLLGLFFMSVGMVIDPLEILANPLWIGLSILGLIIIKAVITAGLARLFGFGRGQAIEIGLLLGQGGEFAFVVIGLAATFALLPVATAQFMLIVVSVTMFVTPMVAQGARRLGAAIEARGQRRPSDDVDVAADLEDHVIIVGYGRTGRLLAELLDRQHVAHVALDLDASHVAGMRAKGAPVFLGDASRAAMLEKMRLRNAAALVISADDPDAAERVLVTARRLSRDLPILVRAHDNSHAKRLIAQGATQVVPEVLEAGLQLGQVMLQHVGLPVDAAREVVVLERAASRSEIPPDPDDGPR